MLTVLFRLTDIGSRLDQNGLICFACIAYFYAFKKCIYIYIYIYIIIYLTIRRQAEVVYETIFGLY